MAEIFVKYYACLVLSLLIFYALGSALFRLTRIHIENIYTAVFARLLTGMILFVMGVSICFTKGSTINLAFFLLALAFFLFRRNEKGDLLQRETEKSASLKGLLKVGAEMLIISLVLFSISFAGIYSSSGIPVVPKIDYIMYTEFSNFLIETGKENATADFIYAEETGTNPYHYFELWMNAGLSYVFQINPLLCLILITYYAGITAIWAGLVGLLSHLGISANTVYKTLCFLFLFTAGPYFDLYAKTAFTRNINTFSQGMFLMNKSVPVYLFLLAALHFFMNKNTIHGILLLLCLPVISISTAAGVFAAGIVLTWIYYRKERPNPEIRKRYAGIFIVLFLLIAFMALFYKVTGTKTPSHIPTNWAETASAFKDLSTIRTIINILGATVIQVTILYFPILLLGLYLLKEVKILPFIKERNFILLVPFLFIFSLLGWAAMSPLPGASVQVFNNISMPVLNLTGMVVFLLFVSNCKTWGLYPGIIVIAAVLWANVTDCLRDQWRTHRYSIPFLQAVQEAAPGLSRYGALMSDPETYRRRDFSYFAINTALGNYLSYFSNTFPMSVSPHDYPFSSDKRQLALEKYGMLSSPFYQFVEKQKQKGSFKDIHQSRIDFIDEYQINYLICTGEVVLDSALAQKITKEIRDENTGERFLLLRSLKQ